MAKARKKRSKGKKATKGRYKRVRIPGRGTRCMFIPLHGRPRFVKKAQCG